MKADESMYDPSLPPFTIYTVVDKSHGFVDNTGWAFQGLRNDGS